MTTSPPAPPLSIGMPVCNGENFLAAAIDSILSQTYPDFELIICDNASTDDTPHICRDYCARDSRVQFLSNRENIGAAANFRRVFHAARGMFFKWAAHDDLLAPRYLEKCLKVLEQELDVVLCHSQVAVIDEQGWTVRHDVPDTHALDSDQPAKRFHTLIRSDLDNYEIFGIMRRQMLSRTPLIAGYIASDRVLRAEIGLRGKYRILPEPLFLCRDHPNRSIRLMPAHHGRGQWFDPRLGGRIVFPHWRILAEYYKCIGRVEALSSSERFQCRLSVLQWLTVHQNWARLLADPVLVLLPGTEQLLIRCGRLLAGQAAKEKSKMSHPRRDHEL